MFSRKNLARKNPTDPAILFDLDGTLLDTVYNRMMAPSTALASAGIVVPKWKIHRRIWVSGKPLVRQLLREVENPRKEPDGSTLIVPVI
jgi:beta-phosphoglucomutase-like phosphatase (HAD superfamily)